MTIQGPVPTSIWGRMWAKALIDPVFRKTLEEDMRKAVSDFLGLPTGDFVEPLFDEHHRMACQSLKDFYYVLEELKENDQTKLERFRDGDPTLPSTDTDIAHILMMTRPNRWTLTELVTGDTCEATNDLVPGAGNKHLNRTHWARVYAGAVLNSNYLGLLKKNPKKAIDDFVATFPGANPLPHNPVDPVLRLPTVTDLRASSTLPIALRPNGELERVLDEIARGVCMGYEATLCVSLSC
ncbi:MAG: hypothetical protein AB7G75_13220 [Candidatus Binatia bacterium]